MAYRFADSSVMKWLKVSMDATPTNEPTPIQMYTALELYYLNNGLYDAIQQSAQMNGIWTEAMKPIRNPAHRVVEFYVSKLWAGQLPDALPIQAKNKKIIEPIWQIWEWSNWDREKQVAARWYSIYGDLFIKIATRSNADGEVERVYKQLIKPHYVTDIETDERGFLTSIRLDIPRTRTAESGRSYNYIHTEIWSKNRGDYRLWEHRKTAETPPDRLGDPIQQIPLSDFGIDFVPFVHAKFKDIGEERGLGSFTHALDKIDETNRMATRLHQIMYRYNKAIFALRANSLDASGRPLPAPRVGTSDGTTDSDTITLGDDALLRLPGMSDISALIPQLNYADFLNTINAQIVELEQDLPELAYYRIREAGGDLSGRAVRLMLTDAIDKAKESRGNGEAAIAQANAMALTIAQNAGLFKGLGTYENGDFDHDFTDRDIFPLSEIEKAETIQAEVSAGIPLITALRRAGWTEDEIKQLLKDKEEETARNQQTLAQMMLDAERRFASGEDAQNQNRQDQANDNQNDNQSQE